MHAWIISSMPQILIALMAYDLHACDQMVTRGIEDLKVSVFGKCKFT
ncbi:hypothetical protein GLYMA_05G208851v4 [Glycine max]|nr:hypothetical protein GLYMA_05G208851v4 [Glycine max]KAH1135541.1 hypothetical protein GYH30_013328 [Glycine max]